MANQNYQKTPDKRAEAATTERTVAGSSGVRKLTPKQEAARRRAQKRRRNRLLITGGLVAVISAALIITGIALSQPTNFQQLPGTVVTDERPFEMGPADAKVTVEEFTDYQCPACKTWHESSQPRLLNDYIKAGKSVKFVIKQNPFLDTSTAQRESHVTTEAAYCASDQKRFWDFHDALYNNQPKGENTGYWTSDRLKELARQLKLNNDQFNKCMDSNTYRLKANADATAARDRNVTGTPSFFVNNKLIAYKDYSDLQKAIDEVLNTPNK